MKKIIYFFYRLLGKELSKEQQQHEEWMADVKYHLYPENRVTLEDFLKEHGKKLWFRRSLKRVPHDAYLVCIYRNPYDVSLNLQAGIMNREAGYKRFLQSMNKKEGWYFVPSWMIPKNSNMFR